MTAWLDSVLPTLTAVTPAFLAYLLGLCAYHKQKEYELVRRRYLDEGLDAYAEDVEHALSVLRQNWAHGVAIKPLLMN